MKLCKQFTSQQQVKLTFYCYNFKMSNEISENCCLCNKPNDQMLMLSCVHDPCINCAASAFAEQIHIKGRSKEVYVCEICGEETVLDSSTIAELTALAKNFIKTPSKAKDFHKNTGTGTAQKRKETQLPGSSFGGPSSSSKKIIYYCKQHSQEEISYYCFTCWANICPECAIHGSHKDHEVKLIKKAISQVKGEYLEVSSKVGEAQGNMGKLKQAFLRMIKQTHERQSRQKNSVTRQFDILRASIASKEKELIRELDQINKQNLAALTSYLQIININYQQANKVKRSIEVITKKDQVLILEDYRKIGQLQQSVIDLNERLDNIAGASSHLNVQFLQQQCKAISESISKTKMNLKIEEIESVSILGHKNGGGGTNSK